MRACVRAYVRTYDENVLPVVKTVKEKCYFLEADPKSVKYVGHIWTYV